MLVDRETRRLYMRIRDPITRTGINSLPLIHARRIRRSEREYYFSLAVETRLINSSDLTFLTKLHYIQIVILSTVFEIPNCGSLDYDQNSHLLCRNGLLFYDKLPNNFVSYSLFIMLGLLESSVR